jgi:hypothetical protein
MAASIARVAARDLDARTFREAHQAPGLPLLITGLLPARPWTLQALSERLGERTYDVRRYGPGVLDGDRRRWQRYCSLRTMTFGEYRRAVDSGQARLESLYLAQVAIAGSALIEELAPLRDLGARLALEPGTPFHLWLGPGGHVEPLHYDESDGTLVQLHGQKQILLFPPGQRRNLYPFPVAHAVPYWFSQVNPRRPDLRAFPRLAGALAERVEVTLNPGELLFLPAGWWHEVAGLGESWTCSVNRFWRVRPRRRYLDVRYLKHPLRRGHALWQKWTGRSHADRVQQPKIEEASEP